MHKSQDDKFDINTVGELAIKTVAYPCDTNVYGDIFGGWVMSNIDIAGAVVAVKEAKGRVATVAVNAIQFHRPVYVGDVVCCYGKIAKIGTTSITVKVEVWVDRYGYDERIKVTEGVVTYVAIGEDRKPRAIGKE